MINTINANGLSLRHPNIYIRSKTFVTKTSHEGDFVFENEWQSFRTKEGDIEFVSPLRKITKGKKIAIKVIDIFGNDTMKIFEL